MAQERGRRQKSRWASEPAGTPVYCGRAVSGRPPALLASVTHKAAEADYCPAGLAGAAGLGADVVAGFGAGAGAGAPPDAVLLSYRSMISFVMSTLGEA